MYGRQWHLLAAREQVPLSPVHRLVEGEKTWAGDQIEFYLGFRESVEHLRSELVKLLRDLKMRGKRIAGYWASAKGRTTLKYFRLGKETVDFLVDRSPFHQGHY